MVNVQFVPNPDGITASFMVNSIMEERDVPFVPERLVDSRGLVLYLFCKNNGIQLSEINLIESYDTDDPGEIKRKFKYMENPIYVGRAIREIEYEKEAEKRRLARMKQRKTHPALRKPVKL